MQNRNSTSAARVAFLFVVAALVLQAAPAWAMPASGGRARAAQLIAAASRHSLDRSAGRSARLGVSTASDFAPGGHAATLVARPNERPIETVALTLSGGTCFTPATSPTFVRRLRE